MNMWTPEEEAARLAERFKGIRQAEFAREHKLPGGPSMLSQHIHGRRPLNMEAAVIYARGFGVSLAEISPRLAAQAADAAKITGAAVAGATSEPVGGHPPADNREGLGLNEFLNYLNGLYPHEGLTPDEVKEEAAAYEKFAAERIANRLIKHKLKAPGPVPDQRVIDSYGTPQGRKKGTPT